MRARSGGETAVASGGHLRASPADREQVIGTLKAAFVQGRLTKDEFDARIGQAFASRSYVELDAITADIPAGLAAVRPLRTPVRALSRPEMAAAWAIYGIVLTVILTVAVVPGQTTIGVIAITAAVIYSAFWLLGGILMAASRRGWPASEPGRSRGRRPCGPPVVHPGKSPYWAREGSDGERGSNGNGRPEPHPSRPDPPRRLGQPQERAGAPAGPVDQHELGCR